MRQRISESAGVSSGGGLWLDLLSTAVWCEAAAIASATATR
jgi:hypothetical protein